jgi:calcineurin-like phosphoesterase family protein
MLNFRETEEKKIYITADLHLGHQRDFVWKPRGYSDFKSHDDGVINSINAVVRPSDVLVIVGDFCLNTPIGQFNEYLSRISCQDIWYLWGNHNNPHEKNIYTKYQLTSDTETYPFKYRNMTYLGYYLECIINGQFVVICHYPIYVFNEMMHGSWMLCGHSHYGCNLTKAENPAGKILDVGWDGPNKPWTFDQIRSVMNSKRFIELDAHHK